MNLEQTCKYFTWIYRLLDLPIHLVNFMDIKLLLNAITSQSIFFCNLYISRGKFSIQFFFLFIQGINWVSTFSKICTREKISLPFVLIYTIIWTIIMADRYMNEKCPLWRNKFLKSNIDYFISIEFQYQTSIISKISNLYASTIRSKKSKPPS